MPLNKYFIEYPLRAEYYSRKRILHRDDKGKILFLWKQHVHWSFRTSWGFSEDCFKKKLFIYLGS